MNKLSEEITGWREDKGFYTPNSLNTVVERESMLGKLMLVVTETSEAAEAIKHNDLNNFKEEIADTFIRLLDICGAMKINIEEEINKKMEINKKRPLKHGKSTNI